LRGGTHKNWVHRDKLEGERPDERALSALPSTALHITPTVQLNRSNRLKSQKEKAGSEKRWNRQWEIASGRPAALPSCRPAVLSPCRPAVLHLNMAQKKNWHPNVVP
jgi:hypothetical protein